MKQLKVDAIKNGTVIDHIPEGRAVQVLGILNGKGSDTVSIGMNLASRKFGRKDILKIENHELTADEVNRIALIAPESTITIIREYEAADKWKVEIPRVLVNLALCPNPRCITNIEAVASRFNLDEEIDNSALPETAGLRFTCHYCEKSYSAEDLHKEYSGNRQNML